MKVLDFPKLLIKKTPSNQLKQWLDCDNPITDKLVELTGDAHLERLSQQWVKATWWDHYALNIKDPHVFQRQILMRSHKRPYWYARTIIPQSTYALDPDFFDRLNKESIRHLIFNQKQVRKVNKLIYPIDNRCLEFYWLKKHVSDKEGILWVRVHEFEIHKKASFYLIELLFPELEAL